ncbi:hypothetical protein CEXT_346901 [Caerostris extrusa]|uniref:Uncharacterized protein n=1 Tax=Caerostris extrusa TaxID=172846 RepID=A0AAV4V7G1_CAEEX|nr:hypothetical protein CEXT_346901 [Caerostris extrusa]
MSQTYQCCTFEAGVLPAFLSLPFLQMEGGWRNGIPVDPSSLQFGRVSETDFLEGKADNSRKMNAGDIFAGAFNLMASCLCPLSPWQPSQRTLFSVTFHVPGMF